MESTHGNQRRDCSFRVKIVLMTKGVSTEKVNYKCYQSINKSIHHHLVTL